DDYITKPVRPEVLAAVVERWVHSSHEVPGADHGVVSLSVEVDDERHDVLDQGQIGLLRSLDDGEGAVLAEVITQYFDQSMLHRDALSDAITANDAPAVERAAHSLRGASANVGASTLAQICGELETLGRAGALTGAAT